MTYPLLDHGPVLTVTVLAQIADMTEAGMTVQETADALGINHRTVRRGRVVTGVQSPLHDGTPREVDDVTVMRAMWGESVELNVNERREAIAQLTARGKPTAEIARILGVTTRTVTRHRSKAAA